MKRVTPQEIFNKDFTSSFRGYNRQEVDEFLDLVIKSYEDVLHENEYIKERLQKRMQADASPTDTVHYEVIQGILDRLDKVEKKLERVSPESIL